MVDELVDAVYEARRLSDRVPLIIHGRKDAAVSKRHHSDRLVAAMRRRHMDVEYVEVPAMGHCGPLPLEVVQRDVAFVAAAMGARRRKR